MGFLAQSPHFNKNYKLLNKPQFVLHNVTFLLSFRVHHYEVSGKPRWLKIKWYESASGVRW